MQIITDMLKELEAVSGTIDEEQVRRMCGRIVGAKRVYTVGRGRSGLIAKMFAMRLMHMGVTAYAVDEVVTPSIQAGDLLIICSGSGETASLKAMADRARQFGADIQIITANEESYLGKMADSRIVINGYTPKNKVNVNRSMQPMGSQFEQLMLFVLEAEVILLKETLGVSEELMMRKHANLE